MSDIWSEKNTILVGPATKNVTLVRRSDEFRHLWKENIEQNNVLVYLNQIHYFMKNYKQFFCRCKYQKVFSSLYVILIKLEIGVLKKKKKLFLIMLKVNTKFCNCGHLKNILKKFHSNSATVNPNLENESSFSVGFSPVIYNNILIQENYIYVIISLVSLPLLTQING